jgi:hypothetical protein
MRGHRRTRRQRKTADDKRGHRGSKAHFVGGRRMSRCNPPNHDWSQGGLRRRTTSHGRHPPIPWSPVALIDAAVTSRGEHRYPDEPETLPNSRVDVVERTFQGSAKDWARSPAPMRGMPALECNPVEQRLSPTWDSPGLMSTQIREDRRVRRRCRAVCIPRGRVANHGRQG